MLQYPKIETLFRRDEETHKILPGQFRRPEFSLIKTWDVTEKIDGTNIRISLEEVDHCAGEPGCECKEQKDPWGMVIRGRTSRAQIPTMLFEHLQKTFTVEGLKALWLDDKEYGITLYGEGYGGGIQKGGGQYTSKTKGGKASFRLFDVFIGETWLDRENVEDIAGKLGIKTVPLIGSEIPLAKIVDMVKSGMQSAVASQEGATEHQAEGIMAFTSPPLFNSRGKRLMFKLKTRDFENG